MNADNAATPVTRANYLDFMLEWETDGLGESQEIDLFQFLIDTGMAWQLQGLYGRRAAALIASGVCDN